MHGWKFLSKLIAGHIFPVEPQECSIQAPEELQSFLCLLPAPASGFTFPAGCCFYMHIWALLTNKAGTLGESSLILGFFSSSKSEERKVPDHSPENLGFGRRTLARPRAGFFSDF